MRRVLPERGAHVLEIAAGSGEHAVYLAPRLSVASWQPSDTDAEAILSIDAWREHEGFDSAVIKPAILIDVTQSEWSTLPPTAPPSHLFCANMIHIAPFECCVALFAGAARIATIERLVLYGPFKRNGRHTAPSNERFDESLRNRDASWGVRDLNGEVTSTAVANGFYRSEIAEMPANNLIVVFDRS